MLLTEGPEIVAPGWARLSRVARGRWRVTDRAGRIAGHVHAVHTDAGWRYAAERFHASTGTFLPLGEFWTPEEACDCLRYAR
ncbi:hypothetical protein ACTU3I_17075 [Microbacterium sp. RD1]|uniref:hypothetical protein n=1 Tax=Microbacterium sp. RD1 TaxID=3457313 RepID=UPI003FA59A49